VRRTVVGTQAFELEFEPHNCFACGTLNEHGLHMDLHFEGGRAWADLALDARFEGWVGISHGGVIATILDEVMGWALVGEGTWGVTARMTVTYRRPIQIGMAIRGEGWVVRSRRRVVETAGRIVDRDGAELATSEATYVAVDAARRAELTARYGIRLRAIQQAGSATPERVDQPGPRPTSPSATGGRR
jgi:uncharacterized protein (TIGR00369 family)